MLFGLSDVGRFGLSHSLRAYARCAVWCKKSGSTMLNSNWFRLGVGPWIRNEVDKRRYHTVFKPSTIGNGYQKYRALAFAKRIQAVDGLFPEDIYFEAFQIKLENSNGNTLLIFNNAIKENEIKCFEEIRFESRLLKAKLLSESKLEHHGANIAQNTIAIH